MSNKKRPGRKSRIIWSSVLSTLLVILVASNVALYYFSDVISAYFSTIELDSPEAREAQDASIKLVEEIADEGIILLQNDDEVLPIDTSDDKTKKVNVFGWSFTNPI